MRSRFTPVNLGYLAVLVASFLAIWMAPTASFWSQLVFLGSEFLSRPWTLFTYPLIFPGGGGALIALVFSGLWLYQIGGQVEQDLGSARYGALLAIFTALSGLMTWVGYLVTTANAALSGPFILLAVITICWATRNPSQTMLMMMVLPVQAKWIAWLSAGLVFFGTVPQLALFAATPLILAWAFAADKLPVTYRPAVQIRKDKQTGKHPKEDENFVIDAEARKREREERERLRKLFESSVRDDLPPDR